MLSSGCIFNMAPGLSGRFPGLSLVAFSALGFIGFFTFVGFIYERFKKIEYKDGQKSKKSAPQAKQKDSKVQLDARDVQVNSQGELTDSQIKHLINVIGTVDEATLENLLISLANCCAFTKNQVKNLSGNLTRTLCCKPTIAFLSITKDAQKGQLLLCLIKIFTMGTL